MLTEICQEIRNWFDRGMEKHFGDFSIANGQITSPELDLKDGQYFRIIGSVFNDGVHKYPIDDSLVDEEFSGSVWAMAVPPAVVALSEEISNWMDKYGDVVNGPYQSESFDGYSYTKRSSSGSGNASDWRSVFGSRLNRWRKI